MTTSPAAMTAASTAEVGKATCLASDQVGRASTATAVARDSTAAIPAYTRQGMRRSACSRRRCARPTSR